MCINRTAQRSTTACTPRRRSVQTDSISISPLRGQASSVQRSLHLQVTEYALDVQVNFVPLML